MSERAAAIEALRRRRGQTGIAGEARPGLLEPIRLRDWAQLEREIEAAEFAYLLAYLREQGRHELADAYAAARSGQLITLTEEIQPCP